MTAREGRTVREVTIGLFEQWLRDRKSRVDSAPAVDWRNFQNPLAHLVPEDVTDHSTEGMRKNIEKNFNEPK